MGTNGYQLVLYELRKIIKSRKAMIYIMIGLLMTSLISIGLLTPTRSTMDISGQRISAVLPRKKLLYVFISIGTNEQRNGIIRSNIEHIVIKNQNNPKYQIDCIVYGYGPFETQPDWIKDMQKDPKAVCSFVKVFKQSYVYFLKSVSPTFIEAGGFDYVTIVLDDVAHYPPHGNVDIPLYYDIIFQNKLGYVTPSVLGSNWSHQIGPRPVNETANEVGRKAQFIEVQAATFRPDVWRCMYDLIDTEFPSGWGIDLWYKGYCIDSGRVKDSNMAIIDTMHVQHNPYHLPTTHEVTDMELQVENWKTHKGIELTKTYPGIDLGMIYYHPKNP